MRVALAAMLLALAGAAFGQASEVANANPVVEQRLKSLAEELRCLVCQNQTIADSSAPLALDLRNQIRDQVAKGRSDDEIRSYMVARYGDFVLYKPPFKVTTAVLWLGPFLLLVGGGIAYFFILRRRRVQAPAAPHGARATEIEKLLGDDTASPR